MFEGVKRPAGSKQEEEKMCTIVQGERTKDPGMSPCFAPLAEVNPLVGYLSSINVEDLHPMDLRGSSRKRCFVGNNVCVLIENEHVPRAFKKLCEAGFLSAPVLSSQEQRYIGQLDMSDFVYFLMNIFRRTQEGDPQEKDLGEWLKELGGFDHYDVRAQWNVTVMDVLKESSARKNKFNMATIRGLSVLSAMEVLGKLKMERVSVLDTEGNVVSIVTTSMIISLIRQLSSLEPVAPLLQMTIRALMLQMEEPFDSVATMEGSEVAVTAFERMSELGASVIAVLDSNGHLVDAISKRDLKLVGYGAERLKLLSKTIFEFKRLIAKQVSSEAKTTSSDEEEEVEAEDLGSNRRKKLFAPSHLPKSRHPALYVTPVNKLKEVIDAMHAGRIHNIFICAEDTAAAGKPVPIGVIHQRDVIAVLLRLLGLRLPARPPASDVD